MDISKIDSYGRYMILDRNGNISSMGILNIEDVRFLREYYQDQSIASNVEIPVRTKVSNNGVIKHSSTKLSREQKYSKPKYRLKEPIKKVGRNILIFGIVVCIGVGAYKMFNPLDKEEIMPSGAYVTSTDLVEYSSGNYMESPTVPDMSYEDYQYIQQVERADFIKLLCQIFQVDYQITYSKLVEMTDDFSNVEYLEGRHPLVTCKGMQIDAQSEEEFLVYAVRVIAQAPSRMDLDRNDVCINDGYDSGTNYVEMITKWAAILNVDPALVYGIMHAETNFNSELFIEGNNPAGLKDGIGSGFWVFPNKEAGIIELMMEIVKYQHLGATTIENIAKIHCPLDDPDDINGDNKNWVENVTYGYERGREIFEEMDYYKNNGLSH